MATVNAVNSRGKGGGGLRGALRYVSQDKKAMMEDGRRLVSGINCCPDTAYTEFLTTKRSFNKTGGRQFYHFTQSFHPHENVTPERVHQIGLELAESRFPGYEVIVATHMDAKHLHSHLIVNSVNFETGKKLHQSLEDLRQHRVASDEICLSHGLTVLPLEPARSETKGVQHREYRAAVRGDSWKFRLMNAIDHCMNLSRTRQDFLENMRRMGYEVAWSDTRKYITYTCPNGMKCRDNKLHDNKYLKEMMQIEFEHRQIERAEPAGAGQAGRAVSAQNIRDPREALENLPGLDAEQSAIAAEDSGGNAVQFERAYAESEYTGDSVHTGGFVESGWEESRRELEAFERTGEVTDGIAGALIGEPAVPALEENQNLAANGLYLAGDIARLARNLGEMSGEPEQQPKLKTVHERKRGIGQKQDDHEQEYGQTFY